MSRRFGNQKEDPKNESRTQYQKHIMVDITVVDRRQGFFGSEAGAITDVDHPWLGMRIEFMGRD